MMDPLYSPKDIIDSGLCIGCGSCVAQAAPSAQAGMRWDAFGQLKPTGAVAWLQAPSEAITKTCPFSPQAVSEDQIADSLYAHAAHKDAALGYFHSAYVGHVREKDFRSLGSSGGMVSWVATELLRQGLVDGILHVVAAKDAAAEGHYFHYRISRSAPEVLEGAKSRYYPIELSGVIEQVHSVPGNYAVVGIPCFIKAIQLLRRDDAVLKERIKYTLGLFCGHMKSARFVESFAWQMAVPTTDISRVDYRHKDPSRPANWYNARLTLKQGQVASRDWWHLADGDWGAGFFMNSACNFCDDVVGETADISFGDAWVEPYSSDGRGTNVVVVRSPFIDTLVKQALQEQRLQLQEVDAHFICNTQEAGFRQRREGLAYRLTWKRKGIQPRKRVMPDAQSIPLKRKLIYRMRHAITQGSHMVFHWARKLQKPYLYIMWAKGALNLYHGVAYQRGTIGKIARFFVR